MPPYLPVPYLTLLYDHFPIYLKDNLQIIRRLSIYLLSHPNLTILHQGFPKYSQDLVAKFQRDHLQNHRLQFRY